MSLVQYLWTVYISMCLTKAKIKSYRQSMLQKRHSVLQTSSAFAIGLGGFEA